jgi:hypothetical protein
LSLVVLCAVGLLGTLSAQTTTLPTTEGKTLADERIVVADAIRNRPTLLIITFSRSAGDKASEWRKALRQKNLPGPKYTLYQIAELEDVPRIIRWSVVSGLRRGIPPAEHSTFVILTKDTDQWKRFASFKNEDDPYLLVLDAAGKIKACLSGEKTPALLEQLVQALK